MMNDDIGLHKIGNALKRMGAISLHLYTPPFDACKVNQIHQQTKLTDSGLELNPASGWVHPRGLRLLQLLRPPLCDRYDSNASEGQASPGAQSISQEGQ